MRFWITLFLLNFGYTLWGQDTLSVSPVIQMEGFSSYTESKVISFQKNGFLFGIQAMDDSLRLAYYDTLMSSKKHWAIGGTRNHELIDAQISKKYIYVLFGNLTENYNPDLKKSYSFNSYIFIRINTETDKVQKIYGKSGGNLLFKKMVCNDRQAMFGGTLTPTASETSLRNCINISCLFIPSIFGFSRSYSKVLAIHCDFVTEKTTIIPFEYHSNISMMDMDMSSDAKSTTLLLQSSNKNWGNSTLIKKIIPMEQPEISTPARTILYSGNKLYSECRINILNNQEKVIFGSIGTRPASQNLLNNLYSFFMIYENQGRQIFAKEIQFRELSTFSAAIGTINYLPRLYSYNQNSIFGKILFHQILDEGDHFLCLGEYHAPRYELRVSYTPQGGYTQRYILTGFDLKALGAIAISKTNGSLLYDSWTPYYNSNNPNAISMQHRAGNIQGPMSVVLANSSGISVLFHDVQGINKFQLIKKDWKSTKIIINSLTESNPNIIVNGIHLVPWYDKYLILHVDLFERIKEGWNSKQSYTIRLQKYPIYFLEK